MATIGRTAAVAKIEWPFKGHWSGFPAWLAWLVVHIFFLIGFRNRFAVFRQWAWTYLTFQDGVRLITGSQLLPGWEVRDGGPGVLETKPLSSAQDWRRTGTCKIGLTGNGLANRRQMGLSFTSPLPFQASAVLVCKNEAAARTFPRIQPQQRVKPQLQKPAPPHPPGRRTRTLRAYRVFQHRHCSSVG